MTKLGVREQSVAEMNYLPKFISSLLDLSLTFVVVVVVGHVGACTIKISLLSYELLYWVMVKWDVTGEV